jgi:uncharacterized protein YecT (DUF1311 family)
MKKATILAIFIFATPALAADEPDCKEPVDQVSMTYCARLDYDKADAELNAEWERQKADAEANDKESADGKTEFADALLKSQRAWLAFRDAECDWQGFAAHGGSMEPMLVNMCLAKLTRDRTKQLGTGVSE